MPRNNDIFDEKYNKVSETKTESSETNKEGKVTKTKNLVGRVNETTAETTQKEALKLNKTKTNDDVPTYKVRKPKRVVIKHKISK